MCQDWSGPCVVCSDLLSGPANTGTVVTAQLMEVCRADSRAQPPPAQPHTFVVKMSRVAPAPTLLVILQLSVNIRSLCESQSVPLQISAQHQTNSQRVIFRPAVISQAVLLESWTDLSGQILPLSLSLSLHGKYFHVDQLPIFTTCNSLHLTRPDCRD